MRLFCNADETQKKFICLLVIFSIIIPLSRFPSNTIDASQEIQSNIENVRISPFINVKLGKSSNIEHEPIQINSNNGFDEYANIEGWEGNGTESNPFLIQGYNITNRDDLIRITNSNVYFQIKNCCLNGRGEGTGIVFNNVSNGFIIENILYNHTIGIAIKISSKENSISNNQISNYTDTGVQLEEGSEFNVVKMNYFLSNDEISNPAIDNGFYNSFVFNFWSGWTNPDLNADGIVDAHFSIPGSSNNNDTYPLNSADPPKTHLLSKPKVVNLITEECLTGIVILQWTESVDSFGHDVLYYVYFSKDFRIWKPLASDIQTTSYSLNTKTLDDGSNYWIRIRSYSSESGISNEVFFGTFSIQNLFTPEIRFLATLFLFTIAASILIGAILSRNRIHSIKKPIVSHSELRNLRLEISYGSFTDEGLVIRGKSDNCHFDDRQLQSMLEYSAMLYQDGKVGDMYGPFPVTNEKRTENKWNYVSLWIKMVDESIEDLRIIKRTGEVPTGILLFFHEEYHSIITFNKEKIVGILTREFKQISKISEITTRSLNEIEEKIYARISS